MNKKEILLAVCKECGRVFDLSEEWDAHQWMFGHDCEAS